ncbi:Synerg-CTERM sorting domain-containing protein [Cloacibacillus porcorum]|uniref:Synerg-CTERM sorting domain-containing protein n=2 Tax=Cloacibacillus porcorum TaxID=1197717 RepID=UPI00248E51F0|nr:Synerg-CTERM sorting domain-containing protein [Cloacibacillus porcorum]
MIERHFCKKRTLVPFHGGGNRSLYWLRLLPFSAPFKFLILLLAALCALIPFAAHVVMADNPTYETTVYCLQSETDNEKILRYAADSYSPLPPTGVVKVDGTHLQITFDRELEYATTISDRDGGSGISMVGTQACSKFKVDDNGNDVGVTKVVPLASPTGAGDRRTFYAVELELEKIVSNSATVSYDPEQGGHNNSLALADPNAGKLTGKFGPISATAPQAQLKTLSLDVTISGQNDGTLMDENTPTVPTRMFEASLADDRVSSVVMTFTLDKESDWSVSVNGAAPNPGAKASKGDVNVGLKEGWNRITLTVGDVSQPGFVTYEIWLYKGTPAYSPVTSITLESESGELLGTVTFADGYLQGYASIPGSYRSVVVKVAAKDDPQSISINGEDALDGKATVHYLVAGEIRDVKITVTSKTGETASYLVELNSRNDDVKLDGLKVYMIDEKKDRTELTLIQDDNGSGVVTGFNKDLSPNAQGYRGYNVQLEQLPNIEKYKFIVVPTVETNMEYDTEVFVSTEEGRQENPIKSGEESKKFTIDGQGKTLPVYITMSRKNPSTGGTDISDYKVRVNLVSQNVEPRLLSLKLYDKFETKDVLKLSQTELNGNEKLFKTEPNSLKFTLSAEIPDDKTITLDTNLDRDKDSYTILDGKLTAAINMVWGEKREIRFTVSNTATGRKYDYKLNLQQGYAGKPFIYLGITPEELSKIWLNGSGPSFRINGISSCIQFDLPTEPGGNRKFSYIVKSDISRFDNLSISGKDDDGSGVMTVDWAVFPPLGQEENPPSFKIANMNPDAEPGSAPIDWQIVGEPTVNPRRTGGTVSLYFSNQSKKAFTYTRSYEPLAEDRKDGIGEILDRLYPVYLQASLPDGRERQGEFAWIRTTKLTEFSPIVANLVEKNPLEIIEFTAEKTPPLTGISILAYSSTTTVVQAGAKYQFKIVPELKTYGQYRKYDEGKFAKKYPNAMCAWGWKWMFTTPWFPIQAQVDFYKQSHPGAGDDVYDAVDIDYSGDPITWKLTGTGGAFKDPTDVSEYATVDQNGIVHAKKHLPMGSLIRLWATTKRLERRAYIDIDIIHENAGDVSTNREKKFAFIALSPRMAFYGSDFQYDAVKGKDYWSKWATVIADLWLDGGIRRGNISWCNLRNSGKEKNHTILLGSEESKLRLKLIHYYNTISTIHYDATNAKYSFAVIDEWPLEKKPIGDVLARIPRYQPYQIAMADFLEKTYKDKNNLFNPPMTVEVSGYPVYGTNIIKNDFTFIVETGSQSEIRSSMASNALRQLRGNSSQDDEEILASERGRWDLEEHHVLSELNMTPEEAGLSEDIVMSVLSDGRTGINMVVGGEEESGGVPEEGGMKASVAGGSVMAAAEDIEWICPDIPGAEEVSVIYGDGTPVSSDFSLYYNKVKELSEKEASGARASRSSSAIPKLAPMKISFAVDSNAFDDLELLGFNYKMKGSDEVYCVKAQGTGANGGFSFSDAAEEEKKKELAASSGGGCNGGFAGLLALFAAVLPLCAIKRGKS